MLSWIDLNGFPCTVLTAAGAVLLYLKLSERAARIAWTTLLLLGLAHGIGLSLLPENILSQSHAHYYLGAKYDFRYRDFYTLTSAALDRPQIYMHDLEHPPAIIRDEPSEQRAYFIDLLRSEETPFDPFMPLPDLQRLAQESGAVHREAERILREHLPPDQIENFRADVTTALITENPDRPYQGIGNDITLDFGYNGSPFYTLVRHIDPTLYFPLSRATSHLNLAWQLAGTFAAIWLLGLALGMGLTTRIATAALFFASWDFVAWNLPGLSFAGWWLPIALAVWAVSRNRAVAGGIAIAWAGLIKLFPFALLFAPGIEFLRAAWGRFRRSAAPTSWKWSAALIATALLAALLLGGISELSGRSWGEFMDKIISQFNSEDHMGGNIALGQALIVLGIYKSPVTILLKLIALAAMAWFLWKSDSVEARPRLLLLVLAAMPFFVNFWFNYYTMAVLVLLPLIAKTNPLGAAISAGSLALAYTLPEFGSPVLPTNKLVWMAKVFPYVIIPAWMVFIEFKPLLERSAVRRWALALPALFVLLVGGEALRQSMVRQYDADGGRYLDQGQAEAALGCYNSLLGIAPGNAMAHMSKGICLAGMQQYDAAETSFRRATQLAPEEADTYVNLARLLAMRGELAEARTEVEKATALAPDDDAIWVVRARIAEALGDRESAGRMTTRALELNPQNVEARAMFRATP